jgi:hypothetical protein
LRPTLTLPRWCEPLPVADHGACQHNDIVNVMPGATVKCSAAGNESDVGRRGLVHQRGREFLFRNASDLRRDVGQRGSVVEVDHDAVAPFEFGEMKEHSWPCGGVHMADNDERPFGLVPPNCLRIRGALEFPIFVHFEW